MFWYSPATRRPSEMFLQHLIYIFQSGLFHLNVYGGRKILIRNQNRGDSKRIEIGWGCMHGKKIKIQGVGHQHVLQ